jgi:hypothetical protein
MFPLEKFPTIDKPMNILILSCKGGSFPSYFTNFLNLMAIIKPLVSCWTYLK